MEIFGCRVTQITFMKDQTFRLKRAHQHVKRHIALFFVVTTDKPLMIVDLLYLAYIAVAMRHPVFQVFAKGFVFLFTVEV